MGRTMASLNAEFTTETSGIDTSNRFTFRRPLLYRLVTAGEQEAATICYRAG
jgi:hypothetical protein